MTETRWIPTRHGGLRRASQPRAAQTNGNPGLESPHGTEGAAASGVHGPDTPGSTQVGHSPNTGAVGGSNPSPRTRFIFKWRERLGLEECIYLVRWRLETPWWSVRLHHWLGPDDDRNKHDHPWDFTTFVLKGGYVDSSPTGDEHLRAPAIRRRSAEHQHTVFPDAGGCWTIIVTGPKRRKWGFWVKGKFVKMNKYFSSWGHHPCD